MKKVLLLFVLIALGFSMTACTKTHVYDIFVYIKRDNGRVIITSLTDEGKQREIVVFPSKIGDSKTIEIGDQRNGAGLSFPKIESEKGKIFVFPYVNSIHRDLMNYNNLSYEINVFNSITKIQGANHVKRRITTIINFEMKNDIGTPNYIEYTHESRTSYRYNYENADNYGLFWTGYELENELIKKPDYDPIRDGYKFMGWYLEEECINEFIFETEETRSSFDLKLYAKWEESKQ